MDQKIFTFHSSARVFLWKYAMLLIVSSHSFCCLEVQPGNCSCTPFGPKRIEVKCTGITKVPWDLPSNTVSLDLSGNHLSSIQEDAFSNLTMLKQIDLSRNDLKSLPENTFRRNPLLDIKLGNNAIEDGFYVPKNVARLSVPHNRLSYDDMRIILEDRKHITHLDISGNQIGPNLTNDLFDGFYDMSYLYLSQCGIKYIANGTFKAMRKLVKLYLSYNKLTSMPDLSGLLELEELDIAGNEISEISQLRFSTIKYVRNLIVRSNRIEQLPVDVFTQTFRVTNSLDLSSNELRSIPDGAFSGCKQLDKLFLSWNRLSDISRQTFAGLRGLTLLMLTGNNLTSIRKDTFVETSLEVLFLHGNRIKHIEGNAFRNLNNLEILTLFANPIKLLKNDTFKGVSTNVRLA